MTWIDGRFEENVITTSLEQAMNWAKQSSVWPMTFGLACCAIEMMATGASRFDLDLAAGDFVFRVTGQGIGQRALAGAVGPHQSVDFAGPYFQIDAVQDRQIRDGDMEIANSQQMAHVRIWINSFGPSSFRLSEKSRLEFQARS